MMKSLIIIVFAALVAGCKNGTDAVTLQSSMKDQVHQLDTANYTTIQWVDSTTKNFGEVNHGEKVKIVFTFMNTGNKPLFLAEVKPSCGCTLADYTKGAVAPGKTGEVVAEYDSNHGSAGQQIRKTISVTANAKNQTLTMLAFIGKIKDESKK